MKLPNGHLAFVDIRKLREYCLNPDSPRGSNKARVFVTVLGITQNDDKFLQQELLRAAEVGEAVLGEVDEYGQRYTLDFEVMTATGSATIRSGWIILTGQESPRLTTCFVLKKKERMG